MYTLQDLMIMHLLDPMHIEGNVCKAFLYHVFGAYDKNDALKTKTWKSREEFQVHLEMWIGNEVCG